MRAETRYRYTCPVFNGDSSSSPARTSSTSPSPGKGTGEPHWRQNVDVGCVVGKYAVQLGISTGIVPGR